MAKGFEIGGRYLPGTNGQVWESECRMFWVSQAELELQLDLSTNRAYLHELQSFQDLQPRFFQKAQDWERARQQCDEASKAFRDWLMSTRRR